MNLDEIATTEISTNIECTVRMIVTGIPDLADEFSLTRKFRPHRVSLHYAWTTDDPQWECTHLQISGPQVKKDGSTGKMTGRMSYLGFSLDRAPEWVRRFTEQHMPNVPMSNTEASQP